MGFFYASGLITFRLNYDLLDMNVSTHIKAESSFGQIPIFQINLNTSPLLSHPDNSMKI